MLRIRLNPEEKQQMEERAKEAGLSISDLIRARAIGAPPNAPKVTPERGAFIRGLAELGKVGSNVNQIARALNRRAELGEVLGVSKDVVEYALHGVATLTNHLNGLLQKDGHSRKESF